MPVEFVNRYDVAYCRANPDKLIVFGDNLDRYGQGGQAIIRYEPNAVGLPTKISPSMNEGAFLLDSDITTIIAAARLDLDKLMSHVKNGGTIVWPKDGIGTGLAELPKRAPAIAEFYARFLAWLQSGAITEFLS